MTKDLMKDAESVGAVRAAEKSRCFLINNEQLAALKSLWRAEWEKEMTIDHDKLLRAVKSAGGCVYYDELLIARIDIAASELAALKSLWRAEWEKEGGEPEPSAETISIQDDIIKAAEEIRSLREQLSEAQNDVKNGGNAGFLRQQLAEANATIDEFRNALELIAAPAHSDGTFNRCREACQSLAEKTLRSTTKDNQL